MGWNLLISPALGLIFSALDNFSSLKLKLFEEKIQVVAVGVVILFTHWAFRSPGRFFGGLFCGFLFVVAYLGLPYIRSGQIQKAQKGTGKSKKG